MFDGLKPKSQPIAYATSPANPSRGIKGSITFSNAQRTWKEDVDVLGSISDILRTGGYSFTTGKSWIEMDSGLILLPGIVSIQPIQKGGVQTLTTVEVSHPAGIPAGVFEFQHSTGDDTQKSIAKGFENWMQLDLPVFLDSLTAKPKTCTFMDLDFPAEGNTPARKRRVVLGPVSHLATRRADGPKEEHPFCPCCLFTRNMDVMKPKIFDSHFYGVRLFAARAQDGNPAADCRLNGLDWDAGKSALMEYVKSWPDRGVEFRKQYVAIHTPNS